MLGRISDVRLSPRHTYNSNAQQNRFNKLTLNVTTSGRNCNTIFDVLTSKMPNADRSKHAFVCVGDFVLIKSEL